MKTVFIPVETIAREFDSKLLLACKLAERGYRVVVAQPDFLNQIAIFFRPGIYFGKNLFRTHFPTSLKLLALYKKRGWSVVHLDEEGGIYAGTENEWKDILDRRIDPMVLQEDDSILCWGDFQRRHYGNSKHSCQIVTTGHPRFNLSNKTYKTLIENTLKTHTLSDFVLVNTNFGWCNNISGKDFIFREGSKFMGSNEDDKNFKRSFWVSQSKIFSKYLQVINEVALRNQEIDFVIRPHPAEDKNFYKIFFHGFKNIQIIDDESALNWISKASCVVHDGCTTGIEAYLLEKPVINLTPKIDNPFEILIPNLIGKRITNSEELEAAIININSYDKSDIPSKSFDLCKDIIVNFNTDVDSYSMIVEIIDQTAVDKSGGKYFWFGFKLVEFLNKTRKALLKYPRRFMPQKMIDLDRAVRQFPGFDYDATKRKLDLINKLEESQVNISGFTNRGFILEKTKNS